MDPYLIPESYYETYKDRFPYNIHPLAFFDYDEGSVMRELAAFGWETPSDTDTNSSNCLLNAFAIPPWPLEYENINFYRVFVPGTEQYGGLDWRAWLVGVEYVSGKPYLFAMTNFEWEP